MSKRTGAGDKTHRRKMIAPVTVTVFIVLYYVLYFGILIAVLEGWWKYALGVIPAACAALAVKVCIERIREIREGEEDDLSHY